MKILFVCSANLHRSKTAEDYFVHNYEKHQFLSAGTNIKICRREGTRELTSDLLQWAEVVCVMEKKHANIIKRRTGETYLSKLRILDIQDVYDYYSADLIRILQGKATSFL
jgi:predicted protein tyrosine phosphatase